MTKMTKILSKSLDAVQYFTNTSRTWISNNADVLYFSLNATDKKLFNFDPYSIEWMLFMKNYQLGIRKYLMKSDESTMEESKSRMRLLKIIHIVTQFGIAIFLILLLILFVLLIVWQSSNLL